MHLKEELTCYQAIDTQEEKDLAFMRSWLALHEDTCFSRSDEVAHFSASCWIVNADATKVLLCFHNIYQNWGWLGGHADGCTDLSIVACKEAEEESGLQTLKLLDPKAISVEVLPVGFHFKNGRFVSSHLHLNCTYLFQADEKEPLKISPNENSALQWVPIEEAPLYTNEPYMQKIYTKLNRVTKKITSSIN